VPQVRFSYPGLGLDLSIREGFVLTAFWKARFYDFNVHTRGKKIEKLNFSLHWIRVHIAGAACQGMAVE
jgi:hypothetical protein